MFESFINLIGKIATACTSLLTIIITISIICFICYLKYSFCRKYEEWQKEKYGSKSNKEYHWQCLLIDGAWGSGKTTHYEKYYQYIDNKPNIYISCFSASRSELIAQIIQQQFWCKLLTLNGLLAKLMESNWQIFMPKNQVVVFDDLERLHDNQDNYLDLIGIIDYLKNTNKCKIILICNMSELKEPIFNTYMERIVDETQFPILISENEFSNSLIKETNDLTKKLLNNLYQDYADGKINNLRIVKNIMPKIAEKLKLDYGEFNEDEQVLNGSYSEIIKLIHKHYLFYIDNALFKDCSDLNNGKIFYKHTQDDRKKYNADLQARLNQFNLNHEDFKCTEYKTFRDFQKILNLNLNDYLRRYISISLDANNKEAVIHKVNEYLSKFVSQQTCNIFELDYVLYLLFVVWTAKVDKYQDYFDEILSSNEFMNQDTFKPVRDVVGIMNPLFRLYDQEQYYQIFGIVSDVVTNDISKFEVAYCLFYRNKVIDKFIGSINQVLWDEVNLFADGWFIRCCNDEDQNVLFILGEDINAVAELYVKSNKYLNLNIIQKWIDKKVEPNTLLEYYTKVLEKFEIEKDRGDDKIAFLDWLLSDKIEAYPKVKEKFSIIREKFTKLNEMIKNYVYIENYNKQYNLLIQEHIDLINKLAIIESNENDRKI